MMSLVPLLIIISIVIAITATVGKIMKRTVKKGGKYKYSTRVLSVVGGYIVLLVISMGVDALLPVKAVIEEKIVDSQGLDQESIDLYMAATEGRIAEQGTSLIRKEWNLNYEGETLNVESQNDEYLEIQIVVERKKDNDGKIEALYYSTPSIVNDMDITGKINPPSIELENNNLKVSNPIKVKLKYTQFQNVLPWAKHSLPQNPKQPRTCRQIRY
jgi:hypothetical protein